ncbi:protein containing PAS domain S-box [Bacteroidales bacterium 6E]|nr:protein containing PAS domain S-box [Bacteroidales bacterium 6E]
MDQLIRILLVEDSANDAELVVYELGKSLPHAEVLVADSLEAFSEIIASWNPHVVVTDFVMPKHDGLEIIRLTGEQNTFTPVIVLSGLADESVAVSCMKAGAVDYVLKSLLKRLAPAIEQALDFRRIQVDKERYRQQLISSENRFRQLFETMSLGVLCYGSNGIITSVNQAALEILGLPAQEVAGCCYRDLEIQVIDTEGNIYLPEQWPGPVALARDEKVEMSLGVYNRAQGMIRWVKMTALPLSEASPDSMLHVCITLEDITELQGKITAQNRESREMIRKTEEEKRAIIDAVPDVLIHLDRSGKIHSIRYPEDNDCWFGKEGLEQSRVTDIFPNDLGVDIMQRLEEAFMERETVNFEFDIDYEGTTHYYDVRIVAINDRMALAIVRDVTNKTTAIHALKQNEMMMSMMTATSPLAFLIIDHRFDKVLYANRRFPEIWGLDSISDTQDLTRLHFSELLKLLNPKLEGEGFMNQELKGLIKLGKPDIHEEILPLRDGRYLKRYTAQIRNADDVYHGRLYIFEDFTTAVNLENSLKRTAAKEKELNDLKSRFIAIASHEFKTPLASVLMAAETIENYGSRMTEKDQLMYIERIKKNVYSLREMIHKILNISKIDVGELSFAPVEQDFREFLESWHADYLNRNQLSHQLDMIIPEQPLHVKIDEQLMSQVLDNLVSNAVKYSDPESPVIIELQSADNQMLLTITDQGIGIPAAEQPFLFKQFYRATNVKNLQGTGLGLLLVRQIVLLHDGNVTITSTEGEGTSVSMVLNLFRAAPQP